LIAAPLKRNGRICAVADINGFPRSIDRGPIEAARPWEGERINAVFPRSIDRGPIEAHQQMEYGDTHRDFRDQLIAAPLKLACRL